MHGDLLTRKCSFLKWWLAQGRKALSLESKAFSFWLENPKLRLFLFIWKASGLNTSVQI